MRMRLILAFCLLLGLVSEACAVDYAGAISAYRGKHGLSAVKLDGKLNALALKQAQAMAASGSVSHNAAGFFGMRVAPLKRRLAAENIGAGFLKFEDMLKEWENSPRPPREPLDQGRAPRRRRLCRQSQIALSQILGDGDYGLMRRRGGERNPDLSHQGEVSRVRGDTVLYFAVLPGSLTASKVWNSML